MYFFLQTLLCKIKTDRFKRIEEKKKYFYLPACNWVAVDFCSAMQHTDIRYSTGYSSLVINSLGAWRTPKVAFIRLINSQGRVERFLVLYSLLGAWKTKKKKQASRIFTNSNGSKPIAKVMCILHEFFNVFTNKN